MQQPFALLQALQPFPFGVRGKFIFRSHLHANSNFASVGRSVIHTVCWYPCTEVCAKHVSPTDTEQSYPFCT